MFELILNIIFIAVPAIKDINKCFASKGIAGKRHYFASSSHKALAINSNIQYRKKNIFLVAFSLKNTKPTAPAFGAYFWASIAPQNANPLSSELYV